MAKQYKTKRLGKTIDIEAIKAKFGHIPAVGNMSVNARGDVLGKGGKVIQKASERAKTDYNKSEKAIKNVSIKKQLDEEKKQAEREEEERKQRLEKKEAKLQKKLAEKNENTEEVSVSNESVEGLKPTSDPNVFEKIEENGDIILVNKHGKPIPTSETLSDPNSGLNDEK